MSKERAVLELFFNEPTKQWHFEELLEEAGISRPQLARWLKMLLREHIILRRKPKARMPHYIANYAHTAYQTRKRLHALIVFEEKEFLSHLAGLPKAQAVIIFGSFNRWDWHKESDIDLFVLGDPKGLDREEFRKRLGREIELFVFGDKDSLRQAHPALLRNIIEGYLVKGSLDFVKVAHA